nr:hypothetical protein [Anaerolineae bacterium]
MAELNLTEVFNDCVDRLGQGQSIDDCLRRYPQYASTLRPMLEAGALVQRMRIQPAQVLTAQTRVRPRFEDALRAPPRKRMSGASRFIYAIAAVLIIGFITIASFTAISQSSLPGDAMYSVKIFSEGLQRSLFDNDALETNFDHRRIQEIQQLLALGRAEDVTFNGRITAQNSTNWVIASLPITVPLDIPNASAAHVNDEVEVSARTSELHLLTAKTIQIIGAATAPIPTPINTSVPNIVKATQTPLITATPSLTPTVMVTKPVPAISSTTAIQVPTLNVSSTSQPIISTLA